MSMQLFLSYDRDDELQAVTERLAPLDMQVKLAEQRGKHKRAYFKAKRTFQNVDISERLRYNDDVKMIEDEYPIG